MITLLLIPALSSFFLNHARADQVRSPMPTACEAQVQADADAAVSPGSLTRGQTRRMCARIAQAEQTPVPVNSAPPVGSIRSHLVCTHVLSAVGGLGCYDWTTRDWYGLGGIFLGTGGVSIGVGLMMVDHPADSSVAGDYACVQVGAGLGLGVTALTCTAYGSGQWMTYIGAGATSNVILQASPILTLRKF